MLAALVSIGTELTRGELVNGNAAWLSERLTALGLEIIEHAVVADDTARIGATLARFGREVKLIVCTGGLGPTSDDVTTAAVAALLGVPLELHEATLERVRERYRRFISRATPASSPKNDTAPGGARPSTGPNLKQFELPRGARVLDNEVGIAPGFVLTVDRAQVWFFPGVPSEMRHLFERHLAPEVGPQIQRTSHQIHIRTFGLRESEVAERLTEIDLGGSKHHPDVTIGYRARLGEVEVKVLAHAVDESGAISLAERVAEDARERLGTHAYGGRDDSFPAHIGRLLLARKLKIAIAESCTGGLIGKLLTDAPGSSEYMLFDAVTYANSAKRDVLGVPSDLLDRHGAVSGEVASAMAEGALARAGADLAVATTGIAGPGGGSADKPVGTVWIALARRGGKSVAERRQLSGDRDRIRTLTANAALELLARAIQADGHGTLDLPNAPDVQPKR
jgi:nicotinamide-nucleotide amidase